jgi:hypothetical protein
MGQIFTDKTIHPRQSALSVFSVVSYPRSEGTDLLTTESPTRTLARALVVEGCLQNERFSPWVILRTSASGARTKNLTLNAPTIPTHSRPTNLSIPI